MGYSTVVEQVPSIDEAYAHFLALQEQSVGEVHGSMPKDLPSIPRRQVKKLAWWRAQICNGVMIFFFFLMCGFCLCVPGA